MRKHDAFVYFLFTFSDMKISNFCFTNAVILDLNEIMHSSEKISFTFSIC